MTDPFTLALAFTLKEEGGYVDNPNDHGGATNRGITQRAYDAWRQSKGQLPQSVELVSDSEVRTLYSEDYWTPAKCPQLPPAIAIIHFDWCVNHGVRGALETLQQALGVDVDGIFGPATAAAVAAANLHDLIARYQNCRDAWYETDVAKDPSQREFEADWIGRVHRLDGYIFGLGLTAAAGLP